MNAVSPWLLDQVLPYHLQYTDVGKRMTSIGERPDRPAPHHMISATRTKRGTSVKLRSKTIGATLGLLAEWINYFGDTVN